MQENPVESHKGAWWKPTFYYLGRYFCVLWNSTKIALKTKCISIVCCKHKLSTTVIIKVMRLSMKATIFPNELYYRTIVFLLQTRCFYCISHWGNCKTSMKIQQQKNRLRRYEPSRTEPSPDFGNPHNKSGWATDFILQYVRPYLQMDRWTNGRMKPWTWKFWRLHKKLLRSKKIKSGFVFETKEDFCNEIHICTMKFHWQRPCVRQFRVSKWHNTTSR